MAIHSRLFETHRIGKRTRERFITPASCTLLKNHFLSAMGLSEARVGFEWIRFSPDFGLVVLCHAGSGEVYVDGAWQRCARGQAYLAPAGVLHGYRADRKEPWGLCWLCLAPRATPDAPRLPPEPALTPVEPDALHDSMVGLYRETTGNSTPHTQALWLQLITEYLNRITQPAGISGELWRLWERVDADLAHGWDVAELARIANTSGETLRRMCLRELGQTPMEHVRMLRMRRAAGLLSTTDEKLDSIARLVGYETIFTFSAAFKRTMKVTPSHFSPQRRKGAKNGKKRPG